MHVTLMSTPVPVSFHLYMLIRGSYWFDLYAYKLHDDDAPISDEVRENYIHRGV